MDEWTEIGDGFTPDGCTVGLPIWGFEVETGAGDLRSVTVEASTMRDAVRAALVVDGQRIRAIGLPAWKLHAEDHVFDPRPTDFGLPDGVCVDAVQATVLIPSYFAGQVLEIAGDRWFDAEPVPVGDAESMVEVEADTPVSEIVLRLRELLREGMQP